MTTTDTIKLNQPTGETMGSSMSTGDSAIFSRSIDLLLLGGLSVLILPILLMIPDNWMPVTLVGVWILADLINHPHFAASYVLFYRTAHRLLLSPSVSAGFKARYLFAGFAIPGLHITYFGYAVNHGDLLLIGYAGNAMLFLVGWHYAKQGFGMLIVDSVYQKRYFDAREKRLLLLNAHACWFAFWVLANEYIHERTLWGVSSFSIDFPAAFLIGAVTISLITSTLTIRALLKRISSRAHDLPVAGTLAYLISIYFWLLGRLDPVLLLLIPMFHSLQYLTIVARLEHNRASRMPSVGLKLTLFSVGCFALGYFAFWNLPSMLDQMPAFANEALQTAAASTFCVWVSINIHHYFLDNVIWKKDNPETSRYLFSTTR